MTRVRRLPAWLAPALGAIGLAWLYRGPLTTRFLNDDYLFLEQARTVPLDRALVQLGALGNYYRPLSRQVYFALLTPFAGDQPLVFHLVNFALFLTALALLIDLLRVLLPRPGVMAGALFFALAPFQRVNLIWVSCSQDLMALVGTLAALALFRRGRDRAALLAYLAALASKEVAFPLPIALAAWALWFNAGSSSQGAPGGQGGVGRLSPYVSDGQRHPAPPASITRRLAPFVALAVAWAVLLVFMRARYSSTAAFLYFEPMNFVATLVHQAQSLLGLDHPPGFAESLARHAPDVVAIVVLGALALWLASAGGEAPESAAASPIGAGPVLGFAALWLVAFALPTGPVVRTWSSYYYTLSAVGAAIALGWLLRRIDRWSWVALVAGLLWWHAGGSGVRAFAVTDKAWGWTSHLTSFYFERGARLSDQLARELRRTEPAPARGTHFFFATLPSWAGFQTGNGALIRSMYRDPTLGSWFYSEFSETTAAGAPCRFLYWDGERLLPLYPNALDPWFQVGSDLMLFNRPAGAAHAFRRGLDAGEERRDLLYWLGWAELRRGRRSAAEAAWQAWGARDDSLQWRQSLKLARDALVYDHDSTTARRELMHAIGYGIGRPEAHGALGELLEYEQPKYALLELSVAAYLNPRDVRARRDLVVWLASAHMDDAASRELQALLVTVPGWANDSTLAGVARLLRARAITGADVVQF